MRRGSRGFARARGEGNDTEAVKLVTSFSRATRKRTGSEYNITSHVFPCICTYIHKNTYIYKLTPPPVDRPCPCDSVLLAGDSAEILYLNTRHTTIICIVDIQRVLLTCHVLRTHAPDPLHMS